jgi:hypothetical protein
MAIHARVNGRDDLRFIAFEPSRRKCKFIRCMVRANGLEGSIRIVNACVGDVCRKVTQIDEHGFHRYDGRVAYREKDLSKDTDEDQTVEVICTDAVEEEEFATSSISPFYFDGRAKQNGNESASESESDDEDDNDGGISMISLDSIKHEILPLGLLHLDVEGWESRALNGSTEILSETTNTCFVICEVWDEKDRKKRHKAIIDAEGKPGDDVLAAMEMYPQFERLDDVVDHERNLFFRCQSTACSEKD